MTAQGFLVGLLTFGAILVLFRYKARVNERAAGTAMILEAIDAGDPNINFILGDCPLELPDGELIAAVLPETTLLEPKTVRVREGHRSHSSYRGSHFSSGSGNYRSKIVSCDELRQVDMGTLVVTNQRIVFMGALKAVSVKLTMILGIEGSESSVAISREDKDIVETFQISPELKLTSEQETKRATTQFTGTILERLLRRAMSTHGGRSIAAAA